MNTYRIEKRRCPVTVVLAGGEVLDGEIFLNPTSRFRNEPQGAAEFLNDAEDYFALARGPELATLVAKGNVISLEASADYDAGLDAPPHPVSVEVTLTTGARVTGRIAIETPPSRARLLDFLNSHHDRFLPVATGDRMVLINRLVIVHVHELS